MEIVWLASYPRSGNTWLRFMLFNYLYGTVRESGDINKLIPDIHRCSIDERHAGLLLCKTHNVWSPAHPYRDQTAGFIYLLRHPKDVLLSNLNYIELYDDTTLNAEQFALQFIQAMGVPRWKKSGYGNWIEHIVSWLSDQPLPHIVLRYETMLEAPRECLLQTLRFLNAEIDTGKVDRAVALSSFDRLKQMETQEKKNGVANILFPGAAATTNRGATFVHRGAKGQSLRNISEQVEQLFDQQFGEVLKLTGYL